MYDSIITKQQNYIGAYRFILELMYFKSELGGKLNLQL